LRNEGQAGFDFPQRQSLASRWRRKQPESQVAGIGGS